MSLRPTHQPSSSQRVAHAGYLGPHTGSEPLEVTVVLRRRAGAAWAAASWPQHPALPRAQFPQQCGADPADLESLRRFARARGLTETGVDAARRVLHLRATPQALASAFAVRFGRYQLPDGRGPFIGCEPSPALPPEAIAVLGLDRRPVAHAHFRRPRTTPTHAYTPLEVGALYEFPPGTDGRGQGVAIIELGGGFRPGDLEHYFRGLGLAALPTVTAVGVAGGANTPGGDADGEVLLDIEVIGALAPGASLAVYFAPNTDQGFYEAISQAAHDEQRRITVMSISWGSAEDSWSSSARAALQSALEDAAALGVSVTVACGDSGSSDGVSGAAPHVDFPSSSPLALACGGTRLMGNGTAIASEVVWNDAATGEGATGGGVSAQFALPAWQANVAVPKGEGGRAGRGVPDVAGNADPQTGYEVFVDGHAQVIGGTSAVAPLWAALIARLNQKLGGSLGDAHAALYGAGARAFRDITSGNNGAFRAAAGWDACTGLGSPRGTGLLAALAALKG
ncbi:MAG TPA: S53 family peptidase [Steroidobacteraceae bacterium]|nr:S53 family peptidase [Steroidobacteraceae bacterium]